MHKAQQHAETFVSPTKSNSAGFLDIATHKERNDIAIADQLARSACKMSNISYLILGLSCSACLQGK